MIRAGFSGMGSIFRSTAGPALAPNARRNPLDQRIASDHVVWISTLLVSACVALHYLHIQPSVVHSFMAMAALKLLARWRGFDPLNRWLILLIAVAAFSNSAWHYGPPLGRDPGVSFLIVLLGLKLLESRTNRDARIVVILGYFMVVTHFLYFTSLPVVVFLFAVVFALTWLLVQLGHVQPRPFLGADLGTTVRMVVQAVPYALILFFLFPRFAGTFWLLQSPSTDSVTGMSETLSLGGISNLVESPEVAFTATFEQGPVPPQWARYWRGAILWDTDGLRWIHGPPIRQVPIELTAGGEVWRYDVRLENDREKWLYALDTPLEGSERLFLTPDLTLAKRDPGSRMASYSVTSGGLLNNRTLSPQQLGRGLGLTADRITDRMRELVARLEDESLLDGQFSASLFAQRLMQHINVNQFSYTLRPPPLDSPVPIDEFLFETRAGFCEHYAASTVTLMRLAGIPSRLVVGYLGGEFNPLTNQIQVRQSDAHAWTEYWDPEAGWIRLDPTAAIAPERIENPIDLASSFEAGDLRYMPLDLGPVASLLRDARWYSAWAKQQWERWFVGFDHRRQQSLLRNIGLDGLASQSLASFAFLVGLGILVVLALWFHRRDRNTRDRAWKLYARLCDKLGRRGLPRHPSEGPRDYLRRCVTRFPEARESLEDIVDLYVGARYGAGGDSEQQLDRLERAIGNLSLPRAAPAGR